MLPDTKPNESAVDSYKYPVCWHTGKQRGVRHCQPDITLIVWHDAPSIGDSLNPNSYLGT